MAGKTLSQINKELGSIYDPYKKTIQQRQSLIPQQMAAEEAGLAAKQEQSFGDILGGARRRGLGFSGIPLAEQAKYTATEYMPALARLKQSGREQSLSLEDALLGINERRAVQAQSIYQTYRQQDLAEKQFREGVRQFNEKMKAQARAQAAAAQAARASAYSPTFGGGLPSVAGAQKTAPKTNALQQKAYNDVRTRVSSSDDQGLLSDYMATASSAKRGNQMDLIKLQLYRQLRPDLFRAAYGWEKNNVQTKVAI